MATKPKAGKTALLTISPNPTPIKPVTIPNGLKVNIKQDYDCCDTVQDCRIRGISDYLNNFLDNNAAKNIGIYEPRNPALGLGIALLCKENGIALDYFYRGNSEHSKERIAAMKAGANLIPLRTKSNKRATLVQKAATAEHGLFIGDEIPLLDIAIDLAEAVTKEKPTAFSGTLVIPDRYGLITGGIFAGLSQVSIIPDRILVVTPHARTNEVGMRVVFTLEKISETVKLSPKAVNNVIGRTKLTYSDPVAMDGWGEMIRRAFGAIEAAAKKDNLLEPILVWGTEN